MLNVSKKPNYFSHKYELTEFVSNKQQITKIRAHFLRTPSLRDEDENSGQQMMEVLTESPEFHWKI